MIRVLMTGATSLLGFTLLECLEGRRNGLELIGLTSDLANSETHRFEQAFQVPDSDALEFPEVLETLIDEIAPDLVIAGRDRDLIHLAELRERRPDLGPAILCGSLESTWVTFDKARSTRFASEHRLAWPPTVICGEETSLAHVDRMARDHPLPWVAKPATGNASRGVYLLMDLSQTRFWATQPNYVIQSYLGSRDAWPEPLPPQAGIPWFTDIGDPLVRSVMVYVLPDGSIGPTFCSDHVLSMGFTRSSRTAEDHSAVETAHAWALSLAAIGWRGPLNIQMKIDSLGDPVPFEINSRFSGAMHGRLQLGFDEMAIILREWVGHILPPRLNTLKTGGCGTVYYRPGAWLVNETHPLG